jgi:ankyrin repeat protein
MFQARADINAGTVTPLIAAAYAGSTDCIKCLLKAGADANIPDQVSLSCYLFIMSLVEFLGCLYYTCKTIRVISLLYYQNQSSRNIIE